MNTLFIVLVTAGVLLGGFAVAFISSVARFLRMTRKSIGLPTSGTHRVLARDLPISREATPALDVVAPAQSQGRPPLILFVPGDGPDNVIGAAKDWGVFRSHAALAADRGYVAAVTNHRSSRSYSDCARMVEDVARALDTLLAHADEFGFDKQRVVVWTFSGASGPVLSHFLRAAHPSVRALLSFYGLLDLSTYSPKISAEVVAEYSLPEVLQRTEAIPCPTYLLNVGRDSATITRGFQRVITMGRPLTHRVYEHGKHGFELLSPSEEIQEELERAYAFIATALR